MALKLIGAGFGRTGTMSMKTALEMLGLGPCHHMKEIFAHPEQREMWRSMANGGPRDWDKVFENYNSSVDWPSAYYWRELAEFYPDAKVLLTVRSSESWYDSISKTIFKVLQEEDEPNGIGSVLIGDNTFGGNLTDRDHAISVYEQNTADVKSAISADRLLVYSAGDGWEPLCEFLDCPVPSEPYPRSNSTDEFNKAIDARREAENA